MSYSLSIAEPGFWNNSIWMNDAVICSNNSNVISKLSLGGNPICRSGFLVFPDYIHTMYCISFAHVMTSLNRTTSWKKALSYIIINIKLHYMKANKLERPSAHQPRNYTSEWTVATVHQAKIRLVAGQHLSTTLFISPRTQGPSYVPGVVAATLPQAFHLYHSWRAESGLVANLVAWLPRKGDDCSPSLCFVRKKQLHWMNKTYQCGQIWKS